VLTAAACTLAAPFFNRGRFRIFAGTTPEYSAAAIDLVESSVVIDMLGLLTLDYRKLIEWQTRPETFHAADLRRIKSSGITVFHPAVGFVEGDIRQLSLGDMARWNTFLAAHPKDFLRIDCAADLARAKAENKIGILLGFQNSEHFLSEDDVDHFYEMGQRVSQLTYHRNRLGGGSTDARDEGLTEFGARVAARMNAIGMAIDVSHCGDRTTLEIIEASNRPVLATHTNCRALVPFSRRCKTDEAIEKLAAKGGVVGVTMVRPFVHPNGPATIENVLDHVDHIARLAGVEHVALGTDQDLNGRDRGEVRRYDLDGLRYSRKVFDFTEGLLRRNYCPRDIRAILGGNAQRAMSRICERAGEVTSLESGSHAQ
jgi:membrane dipeptidase